MDVFDITGQKSYRASAALRQSIKPLCDAAEPANHIDLKCVSRTNGIL